MIITTFELDGVDRLFEVSPVAPDAGAKVANFHELQSTILMANQLPESSSLGESGTLMLPAVKLRTGQGQGTDMLAGDGGGAFETSTIVELLVDVTDPRLSPAFPPRTGVRLDALAEMFEQDRKWLQLIIVDESDLDRTSIETSDFVVFGHTLRKVLWFDVDAEEFLGGPASRSPNPGGPRDINGVMPATCFNAAGTAVSNCDEPGAQIPRPDSWFPGFDNPSISLKVPDGNGVFQIRNSVFIELVDELGPDETPAVTIVPDGINDLAGNNLDSDDATSVDWIAPVFTLDAIGTPNSPDLLSGEGGQTEIIFSSDEKNRWRPCCSRHQGQ